VIHPRSGSKRRKLTDLNCMLLYSQKRLGRPIQIERSKYKEDLIRLYECFIFESFDFNRTVQFFLIAHDYIQF
jgi:hypothetical protein